MLIVVSINWRRSFGAEYTQINSYSNSNVFVNAPYFDGLTHRFRRSSLVVVHPTTSHHMLCVQWWSVGVRVLLVLVFIIAVQPGSNVIFTSYQLSPLTLQSIFAMPHRPFWVWDINLWNTAEGGARTRYILRCRRVLEPLGYHEEI